MIDLRRPGRCSLCSVARPGAHGERSATRAYERTLFPMAGEPEKTQTVEGEATWSLRVGRPPLDINLFRTEKGGNPEIVRESQRRRKPVNPKDSKEDQEKQQEAQNQAVAVVDGVIKLDEDWVRRPSHFADPQAGCSRLCAARGARTLAPCIACPALKTFCIAVAFSAKPSSKQNS